VEEVELYLATLYVLAVPTVTLVLAGMAAVLSTAVSQLGNTGPHGLSEILYSYASAANGNKFYDEPDWSEPAMINANTDPSF